jgi:hypothetical protein
MSDQESRPLRGPEWFLEKIEAALPEDLEEEGLPEATPPSGRLSRAEIDDLVDETLRRELALLDDSETPETD